MSKIVASLRPTEDFPDPDTPMTNMILVADIKYESLH